MRIFITGSNGFLAQKFCEIVKSKRLAYELIGVSKSMNRNIYLSAEEFLQLDLTAFEALEVALKTFKPTHILHTAAITSVESCESNKELAYATNVLLTEFLTKYCKGNNVHLTFISTDFVFDGQNGPYSEDDKLNPVNYYGATKVDAENVILKSTIKAAILRTILVYGAIPDRSRSNLVLWAKGQLEQNIPIKVVADQLRMPTWVDDLAVSCILAIEKQAKGIFHISGEEMMSIEEAVVLLVEYFNFNKSLISSIRACDIGQDLNRPKRTGFVLTKSKNELGFQPTSFLKSLDYICRQLENYGS